MGESAVTDEKKWRVIHRRLLALDAAWEEPARADAIASLRADLEALAAEPRLHALARLFRPGMTRRDLWAALVPVERGLSRVKVTDIDILTADSPPAAAPSRAPLAIVADNIRSAMNMGGLFRTAECFGLEEIILTGYSPSPEEPRVAAAALGAEQWVPWRRFERAREAVEALQREGKRCIALETVASAPVLDEFSWEFPAVILLGSERFGLDPEVVEACDGVVRIPLYGRKNSLNVVSACAIALHAARRNR